MNPVPYKILSEANESVAYTLYLYLAHIANTPENTPLNAIISDIKTKLNESNTYSLELRNIYRLKILNNFINKNNYISNSIIVDHTISKSGLTACSFINQYGTVFICFKGTGKGEWIDNGEGLSGIPEENTYKTYNKSGITATEKTVKKDFATDQQVEALNWFNNIVAKHNWNKDTNIIITGHSKGGNKAQFITINSELVDKCYSFNGQGFSPEALRSFKSNNTDLYEKHRKKIFNFSSANDYINVLGKSPILKENNYYFNSSFGFHYLESMLNSNGNFNEVSKQGKIAQYVKTISDKLMLLEPNKRKYATLGVMNILQRFLGEGRAVNNDSVSLDKTIIGMGITINLVLKQFFED